MRPTSPRRRPLATLGLGAAVLLAASAFSSGPAKADGDWWNPMSWNDKSAHHHDRDHDDHGYGVPSWVERNRQHDAQAEREIHQDRSELARLDRRDDQVESQEARARRQLRGLRDDGRGHSDRAQDLRRDLNGLERRDDALDRRTADARRELSQDWRWNRHLDNDYGQWWNNHR